MIRVGLVGCRQKMPAHLHEHKTAMERNVGVRIAASCARKMEHAKMVRDPGKVLPPRNADIYV